MEELKSPRLLVIGGTGFIGHHLLQSARKKGWQLTSVSLNSLPPERQIRGIRYLHLDLIKIEKVRQLLGGQDFEYVVNLGGYIDHTLFKNGGRKQINDHFSGLQNLVEILNREFLIRFVQIGSSDEYGNSPAPQDEKKRECPISPYAVAKTAGTHFLQMLQRTEHFPVVILRLFLTYGPGQDNKRFLPQIIKGCLDDKIFPTSAGKQLRDFCYVSDTVEAIFQTLINPDVDGQVFNVASGEPISIRTMIENIQKLIGKGKPVYGRIPNRPGENMELYADITKIKKILNWRPHVNLEEGLHQTIKWYAAKY